MPWINGQSGATRIANGGGLVVVNADGSVTVTPASGTGLTLGVAPPATANQGLLSLGNGPWDGTSAGHYVGSAAGTGYAANFASGYTGDLLRLQVAGNNNVLFAPGNYDFSRSDLHSSVFNISNSIITAKLAINTTAGMRNNAGALTLGSAGDTGGTLVTNLLKLLAGGANLSSGSGVPTTPNGQNPNVGDVWYRTDTPTVANQFLYVCTVGGATPTWVGKV